MTEYLAVAEGVVCLASLEQLATLALNERVEVDVKVVSSMPISKGGEIALNKFCGIEQPSLTMFMCKYLKQFNETQKKLLSQL